MCGFGKKQKQRHFLNAKKMPLKAHENVLVFYKNSPTYNPQFTEGRPYKYKKDGISSTNYGESSGTDLIVNDGKRHPTTVQIFKKDKGHHPTQKPVELFRYLIRTYTNPGEIVLDNCMGSGTTAVAATLEGRDWTGFETEPKYVEAANMRLDSLELPSANA